MVGGILVKTREICRRELDVRSAGMTSVVCVTSDARLLGRSDEDMKCDGMRSVVVDELMEWICDAMEGVAAGYVMDGDGLV